MNLWTAPFLRSTKFAPIVANYAPPAIGRVESKRSRRAKDRAITRRALRQIKAGIRGSN